MTFSSSSGTGTSRGRARPGQEASSSAVGCQHALFAAGCTSVDCDLLHSGNPM